jgi:AcrR family transcriptional regulator
VVSDQQRAPRTYRSSRRGAQARHTRQRILDAASGLFLDRGYAGTTVRGIASQAAVSVPTVEALFGTKARILKAAIDVAIAGDDEPVPVLERTWAEAALAATNPDEVLAAIAAVIGPAQLRSAGLVMAVFEGSRSDAELAAVAEQLIAQRAVTAEWIVDALTAQTSLRPETSRQQAIDTVWVLMDPAVFDRLTRHRGWTQPDYQSWLAHALCRLLIADT